MLLTGRGGPPFVANDSQSENTFDFNLAQTKVASDLPFMMRQCKV